MKKLDAELLKSGFMFPDDLKVSPVKELPERILQFGGGVFLRGFADWMVDIMNEKELFNGRIVIIQPTKNGQVYKLNDQDGLYTLYTRGVRDKCIVEDKQIISSVSRGVNPYTDYQEFMKCAENPDLRFIISNTTEAGIAYSETDRVDDEPPASFPGKVTIFLHKRFEHFQGDLSKGFIILPCELIDNNGSELKSIILRLSREWGLGDDFISWVETSNYFLNTLVDRIVTGYPEEEIQKLTGELGYSDSNLNTAEIYHLLVIEGGNEISDELPLARAGLNVIWTKDISLYRKRKVRILNGAHTMTALAAYLYGKDTVKECMDDDIIRTFMNKGIYEEIIPTLDLPREELEIFAASVSERFSNPFIKHYLLSISLNSTSKFKARVLPSILEYIKRKGTLPEILTFSFSALIAFYNGMEIREGSLIGNRGGIEYKVCDDIKILQLFQALWVNYNRGEYDVNKLVAEVLGKADIWGLDLNHIENFTSAVAEGLHDILENGIMKAIKAKLKQ